MRAYQFGSRALDRSRHMDEVDSEITERPEHWDMRFIRNFMLVLGPMSSIFVLFHRP
jgi:hypothetical protein